MSAVERSGWLKKQGHKVKNWKTRFFVLRGDKLYYYTNPELATLKGTIPLLESTITDDKRRGAKNFILKTRDGTSYFIEADSEADKDNWINWISTNEIVEVAYAAETENNPTPDATPNFNQEERTVDWNSSDQSWDTVDESAKLVIIHHEENETQHYRLASYSVDYRYLLNLWVKSVHVVSAQKQPECFQLEIHLRGKVSNAAGNGTDFYGIRFSNETFCKAVTAAITDIQANGSLPKSFMSMELKGENEDEMNQKKNNKNQEQGTIMGLFGPKKRVLPPANQAVVLVTNFLNPETLKDKPLLILDIFTMIFQITNTIPRTDFLDNMITKTCDFLASPSLRTGTGKLDTTATMAARGTAKWMVLANLSHKIADESTKVRSLAFQISAALRYMSHPEIKETSLTQVLTEITISINCFALAVDRLLSAVYTLRFIKSDGFHLEEEPTKSYVPPVSKQTKAPVYNSTPNLLSSSNSIPNQSIPQSTISPQSPLTHSVSLSQSSPLVSPTPSTPNLNASNGQSDTLAGKLEEGTKEEKEEEEGTPQTAPPTPTPSNLQAGTFEQLVYKLTSDQDSIDSVTFIRTYRSFATPSELLDMLKQRYTEFDPEMDEKRMRAIQLRVAVVLKYWIENSLNDFDTHLMGVLEDFLRSIGEGGLKSVAQDLLKYVRRKQAEREQQTKQHIVDLTVEIQQVPEQGISLIDLILETKTHILAEQLTMVDCDHYYQIEASELLNESWTKPKLKYRAPNVLNVIGRATALSFWVATLIQLSDNPTTRSKVMTKMIKIGKCLMKLNNLNTMTSVIGGMTMNPIFRLKNTFARVAEKHKQIFAEIQNIMNPQGSYKNHREFVKKAKPPYLPYLGILLTDLTMIETGTTDYTKDGLINYAKREKLSQTIGDTTKCMSNQYSFPKVEPIYTMMQELPHLEKEELFAWSLLIEPRVA
ncbi:Ras guanine nucleotide exchange factor [Planoprotostelium fungivorum]|uniref:Ras guanine nucleotide exchange factor n=1 Tax=Planoprotostelium fungivorum TaxID=1890364 RepID=A0A2P6NAU3_9EUKA|nr:Ras guanine nucleotide exchange factor [Planoprotostelium fungivorum]